MASAPADIKHPAKYQFGEFELTPAQGALWRNGERVPVMPKPMAALIVLVERAGQTVSKDELLASVWNGAAVEDNNVTQTISAIRKALGEKAGENRFIVTEPGSGYRFVAEISDAEPAALIRPEIPSPPRSPRWMLRKPAAGAVKRRSVAVLGMRDLSKDSAEAWLQTALPQMLTSELASGGKLHVIPVDDIAQWRAGLSKAADGGGNASLLRMARLNFGADAFVLGSYVVSGVCPDCRVRVDLTVFDAHSGENLASIIDEAPSRDMLDLATRLGAKLRGSLGAGAQPPQPSPFPAPSAMREYAEGLKSLQRIDPMAARDHLEAAAAADPGNPLIHSALADAWAALGYLSRAADESRRAYQLSPSLSRLDQLGIEARYRATAQQWDRAIEIYRDVFRLFPDSLEDGLNLAQAQYRAMKNADALSTLGVLRKLPKPAGGDPRIDLLEARIAGTQQDFAKTRDYAHRAAVEAKERGATYLFARARLLEGGAMQSMSDPNFEAVENEARKLCEQFGDRQCVSQAWRVRGNDQFSAGRLQEAQAAYLEGIRVARDLGDHSELANLTNGLGVVAESNLQWQQAEQNFSEAISLKKETGYNPSNEQMQLAQLYFRIGRFPDAARTADAAYSEAQKTGAREQIGEVFSLRAALARLEGRLDAAQQFGNQAIAEFRASQSTADLVLELALVSSISTARGDLPSAERNLAEAAKANQALRRLGVGFEADGTIARSHAELLLAQGQWQEAAEEGKHAAAEFSSVHLHEGSVEAFLIAARALEMSGRNSEALEACRQAEREGSQTADPLYALSVRLTLWRLSGGADPQEPPDLRSQVASLHNPELSLEEDLDRAVRAKRAGASDARRLFDDVATRAANTGYLTLARRARSLE